MKRILWISILVLLFITSCANELKENSTQESINVGNQSILLTFSSEQPSYEGIQALSTILEIENKSDQPVYLPWGNEPGYNLIIIGLDSSYRTIFGKLPPTPETDGADYLSIQPGDKITTHFPLPHMPEPGRYNVCAEILLLGISNSNEVYDAESGSLKTKICTEVLYK